MATTIYFSGSISGGREDVGVYRTIVAVLREHGHRVLAGSVAEEAVTDAGDELGEAAIFDRDMGWIAETAGAGGVLVAEVSRPSTGVGYEIAAARHLHRMRVICLYRPAFTKRCSAMVAGDPGIELLRYETVDEMLPRLLAALANKA